MYSLDEFDYPLPKEHIAQEPIEPRDSSKFLVLEPSHTEHRHFSDLPEYLKGGDVLVLNNTRVSSIKLIGKKKTGGNVRILVLSMKGAFGKCLINGKNMQTGTRIFFGYEDLYGEILTRHADGKYEMEFSIPGCNSSILQLHDALKKVSQTPLPPYIKKKIDNGERYQTVYGRNPGSAAAPTAGLHFTQDLLKKIRCKGIKIVEITLHIGPGTFTPITEKTLESDKLESEFYSISKETATIINSALQNGERVIPVGTTSIRALESSTINGKVEPNEGTTELFIHPGYRFKITYPAIITNFHLPRSTLLMLVCTYAGTERLLAAYKEAIANKYRFYSFGDAMLIFGDRQCSK